MSITRRFTFMSGGQRVLGNEELSIKFYVGRAIARLFLLAKF